jgi:hypothetical protein
LPCCAWRYSTPRRCGTNLARAAYSGTETPVQSRGDIMGMGKGLLLWMLGIPLPIIILLAIFWH